MRALYIRQDSLSAKGASVVRDADKRSIYLLIGKWGRHQDALSLYQISGDLLAELRQTSLGLLPHFDIYYQGNKVGAISKHLGFFNEMIYINNLHWIIVGNFVSGNYKIYHGTTTIMTSRSDGDLREMQIISQSLEPICVCIAATLDHWASGHSQLTNPAQAWHASLKRQLGLRGSRAWHYANNQAWHRVLH
jgi:uncharacterized protein YxjI